MSAQTIGNGSIERGNANKTDSTLCRKIYTKVWYILYNDRRNHGDGKK